jgi:transcriptional regulator with XRE-family HTH domain
MDIKGVGQFVRQQRKEQRLTQVELAAQADVSVSFIGRLERGTVTDAPIKALERVFAVFGITFQVVLVYPDHRNVRGPYD